MRKEAEQFMRILRIGEAERRAEHEAQKLRNKEMKNPHNYPRFDIDGLSIYAINEEAAKAKAAKILKHRNRKLK